MHVHRGERQRDERSARGRAALLGQLDALDDRALRRLVAGVGLRGLDLVDRVHPVGHLAEDGVLAVEPGRGVGRDDEELGAVGVRAGVGHGERAAADLVVVDLVLERVAGAARAGAGRVTALDHEVLDHAVEDHAVVEAVTGQLAEVLDGLRGVVVEELDADVAVARLQDSRAHLPATSSWMGTSRTRFPLTFATTSSARSCGTSTKLKRWSMRTFCTSSPSSSVLSTIASTTSLGSRPEFRPAPTSSFVRAPWSGARRGLVWRGRRACSSSSRGASTSTGGTLTCGRSPLADHGRMSVFA